MAKPAASSFALLMRKPEESLSKDVDSAFCDEFRLRCAFKDAMFVLMTWATAILL